MNRATPDVRSEFDGGAHQLSESTRAPGARSPGEDGGDQGCVGDGDGDMPGPLPGSAGGGQDGHRLPEGHLLGRLRLAADLGARTRRVGAVVAGPAGQRQVGEGGDVGEPDR